LRLFKKLRRKLEYFDEKTIEQIHQAYLLALDAHRGQKRRTGEPYITHPVAVACILADMKMDAQTIMAAILHDVIEDTPIDKETLAKKFGKTVADLVDGVSKLTQIEFANRAQAQAENFRKMVLAMARDIRVILVKLADRLHNMRTLESMPPEKKRRISRETLDIFAPIAKRLGMRDLSVELEDLGFLNMHPHRYAVLKEAVRRARGNRKKVLALIDRALREGIAKSNIQVYALNGREKHLHSIYRKMRTKRLTFNEIMDVYAFRIIVDDLDDSYRMLGVVHSIFKPVPERFKDYIAIPKANGYQSLHTTLFGPYGLPIEVQIRTTEMNQMATSGIAAHWLYKAEDQEITESQVRAQQWVKNLLELQQSAGNSLEFIESVKVDLFPHEIYVFTPKGDIKELPIGATAIDFAYAVHTDVGNSTVGVKINRHFSPLSATLTNGQTVEVVTSSRARPNPAWLDFVTTSKARSGIRHYLKNQRQVESIALGKQLLQKALLQKQLNLRKINSSTLEYVVKEAKLDNFDELLSEIGLGNRVPALVAQRIFDVMQEADVTGVEALEEKQEAPLIIQGTEGMLVEFAPCCRPVPGDPIVGVLNAGKGIQVHVERCRNVNKLRRQTSHTVPLRWADKIQGEFLVNITVDVINDRGILAVLALSISDADANIEDIKVNERDGQHFHVEFSLMLKNRAHLAKVMRSLRQVQQVVRINRAMNAA